VSLGSYCDCNDSILYDDVNVWLCLWPNVTDGSQPLRGVKCVTNTSWVYWCILLLCLTLLLRYLSDGTNLFTLDDKRQEQTCARVWSWCFVSPTISYLLLQSKVIITVIRLCVSFSTILCSTILLNVMHIGDWYRDFPLLPVWCRNPLFSRSRQSTWENHSSVH
jgi:hypothetical protein